ncbi:MAG: penicillin-binding protein 2 [Verrucomicrobia bacterium]|nr:MAG: penicillin-binding protein 2 [Verrucomicrobiota bacterium]
MNRNYQYRCFFLCTVLVIALSGLSGRLIQIQLVNRQRYVTNSHKAFQRIEKLPATRGMIVDRNERTLAKSETVATLFVDKKHLNDVNLASYGLAYEQASSQAGWAELDAGKRLRRINGLRAELLDTYSETKEVILQKHLTRAVELLARPLGMRREDLRDKIENSAGKWVAIAKDIPEEVADQLRSTVDQNLLQGFDFENALKRRYSAPTLAAHLTGFTGEVEETDENEQKHTRVVGKFGVEWAMEEYLTGRDGWRQYQRDAHGLVKAGDSNSLQAPRSGLNVQLSIDLGIQAIVEEEIDAAMVEFKSERAAVVMMDPHTGEVLAMVSRPNFDLNRKENLETASFNFAIQAIYEPGSTYKLVATSGVLNEGLATPQTSVFCCNGKYVSGKIEVPDHFPYGMLTLEGVLAKSSNIGAYKFALQLGPKRFYDYVKLYGFGKKTGILLSGESSGIARNTGNPVDFSRAAYGYALNVTPLQMACAYCVPANGGKLLKPQIIKSLIANDGTVVQTYPPETVAEVIKPKVATQMRAAMEKVIEKGGTATLAAVPGFRVAGKTGTAKRHNPHGRGYLPNSYTVSFVGMLPAENPAFVCVVVIDDPKTDKVTRYGGTIAAPAFAKIATRVAAYLKLKPTEPIPNSPLATITSP